MHYTVTNQCLHNAFVFLFMCLCMTAHSIQTYRPKLISKPNYWALGLYFFCEPAGVKKPPRAVYLCPVSHEKDIFMHLCCSACLFLVLLILTTKFVSRETFHHIATKLHCGVKFFRYSVIYIIIWHNFCESSNKAATEDVALWLASALKSQEGEEWECD